MYIHFAPPSFPKINSLSDWLIDDILLLGSPVLSWVELGWPDHGLGLDPGVEGGDPLQYPVPILLQDSEWEYVSLNCDQQRFPWLIDWFDNQSTAMTNWQRESGRCKNYVVLVLHVWRGGRFMLKHFSTEHPWTSQHQTYAGTPLTFFNARQVITHCTILIIMVTFC